MGGLGRGKEEGKVKGSEQRRGKGEKKKVKRARISEGNKKGKE